MFTKNFNTLIFLFLGISNLLFSQILTPAKSSFSASKYEVKTGEEIELKFTYSIDKTWYMYSNDFSKDLGPIVTSHTYKPNSTYKLAGKTMAIHPKEKYDDIWGGNVRYFVKEAVFIQKVIILKHNPVIEVEAEYQVCSEESGKCISFNEDYKFDNIKVVSGEDIINVDEKTSKVDSIPAVIQSTQIITPKDADTLNNLEENTKELISSKSLDCAEFTPQITPHSLESENPIDHSVWYFMLISFFAGLLALVTPCVFPMIPLTVSYFTKKTGKKSQAFIYGLSIIIIYVLLGMGVTVSFGSDTLNSISTNAFFNILFFAICIIFGVSFLGMFEINLPTSWVNKMDSKAEHGGWIGTFFMAFTLVLVSFSCTGPIVGTLLVTAATGTSYLLPALGMFSFSLAFALPFTLFAIFPSWLHTLPKSGGWLNSVKVVLGIIEIALAFKFLSVADATYHWNILDREVYLSIWIVLFTILGFYFLGKIRFYHDDVVPHITVPKFSLAVITFSFVVYMIPGLWGAPLKALSGWLPMTETQDFVIETSENKLTVFHDYCEGMNYAKNAHKPVMLDFTGYGCVNCRRMEAGVWTNKDIEKILSKDYVIISLYVDDKKPLPTGKVYISEKDKKQKKTFGAKWSELQATYFNNNAQPFYVLVDNHGKTIAPFRDFNLDILSFKKWLEVGIENYRGGR